MCIIGGAVISLSNCSSDTCVNAQIRARTPESICPGLQRSQGQCSMVPISTYHFRGGCTILHPCLMDDDPWGQACSSAERWKWLLNALINPRYEIFSLIAGSLEYRSWMIERETLLGRDLGIFSSLRLRIFHQKMQYFYRNKSSLKALSNCVFPEIFNINCM